LVRYMDQNHAEIEKDIVEQGKISDETESALRAAIEDFKKGYAG